MSKEVTRKFTFHIDPKHYSIHNYLIYCSNVSASILKQVDQKRLCRLKVNFRDVSQSKEFDRICDAQEDWQKWLIENDYKETLYSVYYAHTFYSLVADFGNYLLESINCAAQMKVSVSYALLRKPFKDTLAYIEWLFVDHEEMITRLLLDDPSKLKITPIEAKKRIDFIKETTSMESFFAFRYDQDDDQSLEHIWNNANHIITTRISNSRTQPGSLNFVFTDEESLREYSDYYYFIVPGLLSYATDLICHIFESLNDLESSTIMSNHIIRSLRHATTIGEESTEEILETCNNNSIQILCPNCGKAIPLTLDKTKLLLDNKFSCTCNYLLKTDVYMFDWEES